MLLDLREVIGVPGAKVSFDYEPNMENVSDGSIIRVESAPRAAGNVTNRAGVLTLTANVDATSICVCARCLEEFELPMQKQITAYLTEGNENEQESDNYFFLGDKVDIDEIITTEFLLNLEDKQLCHEDCAGLCPKCGSSLNEGLCNCKMDIDPRLEKLAEFFNT